MIDIMNLWILAASEYTCLYFRLQSLRAVLSGGARPAERIHLHRAQVQHIRLTIMQQQHVDHNLVLDRRLDQYILIADLILICHWKFQSMLPAEQESD